MTEESDTPVYILVAEDNPADVYLVREALHDRDLNCSLHILSDGEQAIDFVDHLDGNPGQRCPELLLLDLHLPKRDGKEILGHWRASPRCGQIPVIIFTSSDDPRDLRTVALHDGNHYFRKPTTLDEYMALGDVVKSLVKGTLDIQGDL